MRILRIATVLIFIACLALYVYADISYNARSNTEGPVLTCTVDALEISIHDDEEALFAGLTAQDAQDGDLTQNILMASSSYFLEDGSFEATYVVFDSHHNSATVKRSVRYTDYTSPRIQLSRPLVYSAGNLIRYLNYLTAYDVLDGDISDKIKVVASNISAYTPGVYPILLEVTNSYGDTLEVELRVVVQEADRSAPQILLDEYITYVKAGEAFDPYTLLRSAETASGNAISESAVTVYGSVDTQTPGCYQLVYSCSDGGHEGRAYLTVVVEED